MKAELITRPYSDLTVVNAARVSFDKESDFLTNDDGTYAGSRNQLKEEDIRLINYLARHNHWTPFSHVRETFFLQAPINLAKLSYTDIAGMVWEECLQKIRHSLWGWSALLKTEAICSEDRVRIQSILATLYPHSWAAFGNVPAVATKSDLEHHRMHLETNPDFIDFTMRETVPIFVARQRFKHMVGFTYNEVSRRYVDDTPELFSPDEWRGKPDGSIKQGSAGVIPRETIFFADAPTFSEEGYSESGFNQYALNLYRWLLLRGVAPEQARMILPQSMYTSYYVTAPLSAWKRAMHQRLDPHAQKEIQDLAKMWEKNLKAIVPDCLW